MLVRVQFEVWRAKISWGRGQGLVLQVQRNTFFAYAGNAKFQVPSPENYV